jgi:hypothetical protein
LQGLAASTSHSLQSQTAPNPKKRLLLNRLEPCSRTTLEILFYLQEHRGAADQSLYQAARQNVRLLLTPA